MRLGREVGRVTVTLDGREQHVRFAVSGAEPGTEADYLLPLTLFPAMARGHRLRLPGEMSPRLISTVPKIQDIFGLWLDVATELGVATLNAAPYGSGILAKGPDAYARYQYGEASGEVVERVRKMQNECRQFGVPLGAAALQFSLRDPRVVSTIVGISRPERIGQTLDLATRPVPEEMWARLE